MHPSIRARHLHGCARRTRNRLTRSAFCNAVERCYVPLAVEHGCFRRVEIVVTRYKLRPLNQRSVFGIGSGIGGQLSRSSLVDHPDLGGWRGPNISERTRRAINAAGGMAYLSECTGTDLVFARQRFMESYLRWDELKQDEYLLPEGEVKKLLSEAAEKISVTHLLEAK